MVGQYEELSCPFCDKGRIQALHIPGAISVKRSSARSLPGKQSVSKSKDVWLIQSGCNVCGKTCDEVEKKLRRDGVI
jgi:hypothetical protein